MKIFNKLFLFIIVCFVCSCFVGCDIGCVDCNAYIDGSYFLINATNTPLYYESYNMEGLVFNTTLLSKDTLFLYSVTNSAGPDIDDAAHFYSGKFNGILVIKNDNNLILFLQTGYTTTCGSENFVSEKRNNRNYYHYWTIDSAYIADKACNMTLEEINGFE